MDLGAAHFAAGRFEAARTAYESALILTPREAKVVSSLAMIDLELGALEKARIGLEKAVRLDPKLIGAWRNLAGVSQNLGLWSEAARALRQAAALDPSPGEVRFALGWALTAAGDIEAARAVYGALAADEAWRWPALARIALLNTDFISLDDQKAMAGAARDETLPLQTRTLLWFALGPLYEAGGEVAAAYDAFAEGNRLERARLSAAPAPQRPEAILAAHRASATRIAQVVTPAFLARQQKGTGEARGAAKDAPIFIVGMPRSGSTLIEQILSRHPSVAALGETAILPELLERQYPPEGGFDLATPASSLAEAYWETARRRGWRGGRPTDKTLENYLHVGVIALMFPRAVILHAVRDPMDTGLACWRTLFREGAETLYDLAEIGAEYVAYARLMDHWRQVLPGRVIDVSLEALTADPEGQIRRLLDACGLAWNRACLRPWEGSHPVRTASAAQVRRPITPTGTGRWRLYAEHLSPLKTALAGLTSNA